MLLSFKAAAGYRANQTFYFPYISDDDARVGHTNRQQNAYQDMEELDGVWLTFGGWSMPKSYAEITGTFDLFPAWLKNNSNKNYYAASNAAKVDDRSAAINACIDFMTICVDGGLGTLKDTCPTGTLNPFTGQPNAFYTATAIINGDYTVKRIKGAYRATVQCTLVIPSGYWTTADGNYLIPVH